SRPAGRFGHSRPRGRRRGRSGRRRRCALDDRRSRLRPAGRRGLCAIRRGRRPPRPARPARRRPGAGGGPARDGLHRLHQCAGALKAGETLLIHGATSGIGVTAIQMARAAGARVVATSRGLAKAAAARDLGADLSLDAETDDLEAAIAAFGGADVVLDMVGADYAALNLGALKPQGRWVVIATLSGARAEIDLARLMIRRI